MDLFLKVVEWWNPKAVPYVIMASLVASLSFVLWKKVISRHMKTRADLDANMVAVEKLEQAVDALKKRDLRIARDLRTVRLQGKHNKELLKAIHEHILASKREGASGS